MDIERRDFLKRVGVGSLGLATMPTLAQLLATPAWANGPSNFHFVALSTAGEVEGVTHVIAMNGDGVFGEERIRGGGAFVHFNNDPDLPAPKPIIATGTWEARRFVGFESIGTWGVFEAGVLRMRAALQPVGGPEVGAAMQVVCNLGPAGLINVDRSGNPLAEGYTVRAAGLTFVPFEPPLGLTVFTTVAEPEG